ncbi:hypothetical protein BCR32DRAFT_325771 [Anaeromyces robustus]|uniref:Uncharacterized protein n=1 Tax=Anaeromyces robustus TaxID=1754192 RepID=A0A1Y1XH88_9FUNG|nr:hypothetical protein BCR32DRAFT_325771 [Anaeromyces robustus]|eukprot:ORX84756.1 hypothetical protein BCR32DRAFT_325771 [Anaeromyces robustus]
MGNVVSNANEKGVGIKVPTEPIEIPEDDEDILNHPPSETLLSFWKSIAPGSLNDYIPVYIDKPYKLVLFDDNEMYEGYENYDLIKGCLSYRVLTIWDATDGHINFYELLTGENAGKLAALSYGNLKAYIGKTLDELIEVAEKFEWKDEEEDMLTLFKEVFGDF